MDLEALERMIRDCMHHCGAITLEHLLGHEDGSSLRRECDCGGRFVDKRRRSKTIRTVLGEVRLTRTVQRCNRCHRWRVAEDEVLDVVNTGFSPGVRRMMAMTGAEVCFDRARDLILELGGIRVTDKDVERVSEAIGEDVARWEQRQIEAAFKKDEETKSDIPKTPPLLYITTDATGVPVVRRETEGRRGKGVDGVARHRDAKLGAVFTQTATDAEGNPVRDPQSTTYVGGIETSEDFGLRLYVEARQRGLETAGRVVIIGDGAPWIWNLADLHFPHAVQVVDYYHAAEHLGKLSRLLYSDDEARRKHWYKRMRKKLSKGKVGTIICELRRLKVRGQKKQEVAREIAYFENNRRRMRYHTFRKQRLFIGSGVVEAGCKMVIGKRLKQSGMHWSVRGANAIIALRCCIESGEFETYWESRCAA